MTIVTIESYDQVKGRGVFVDKSGQCTVFSYKDLCGEVMIPVGAKATWDGKVLHRYLTPWQYFIWWFKEVWRCR